MGLDDVKELTHTLETIFDQFRSGARALDRATLEVCFRCLDDLREYHRQLRDAGQGTVDLASRTAALLAHLAQPASPTATAPEPEPEPEPAPAPAPPPPALPPAVGPAGPSATIRLVAEFEPGLPWPDMKAKLILTRLSARARIVATEPPVDKLDEVQALPRFVVWLVAEGDPDELRALADVDGVVGVAMDAGAPPAAGAAAEPPAATASAAVEPTPEADIEPPPTVEAPAPEAAKPAGSKAPRVAERAAKPPASRGSARSRSTRRTGATASSSPSPTTAPASTPSGSAARSSPAAC